MSTVAQLLQQARSAHEQYRMNLPRHDPRTKQTIPGNADAAAQWLRKAMDLRAEAENADQAGDASAWRDDASTHPHYALLRWYDQQLAPAVKFRDQRVESSDPESVTVTKADIGPIVGTLDEAKK